MWGGIENTRSTTRNQLTKESTGKQPWDGYLRTGAKS